MSANIKPAASTALVLQDEGGTDVITISTAGNVGVGNGSPTQKLDVTGNINASGALTLGTALAVAEGGTGSTTESAARTALGLEIGSDVQAYDADTAKYDDTTANFTGTLQNGGSNVVVDSDIGSTVQAYDADTTKNDVSNTFSVNQIISVSDNTNAALRITQTGTGNALVVEDDTNPDSTPFVVDNSGRLLVGTGTAVLDAVSTISRFQVKGLNGSESAGSFTRYQDNTASVLLLLQKSRGTSIGSHVIVQDNDEIGRILFAGSDGSDFITIADIRSYVDGTPGTNDMPGRLVFSTTADNANSPTERMRIDSSGNVGIGNSSPAYPIDVTGNAYVSGSVFGVTSIVAGGSGSVAYTSLAQVIAKGGTGNAGIVIDGGTTSLGRVAFGDGALAGYLEYSHTDDSMRISTAGSERMRIDSSGNVLIGYTSSNGSYKLQVNSQIFATSATIATSDGRYKENVTSLDGALNLVAQLNPVQFNWKEHPVHEFDRTQPTVGFIAQEVQEVLKDTPYVNSIIKANECLVGEERDEEGNIITEGTIEEFLGIAEGNLIALLTKALQEANAKIDALETRIQALEV